MPCELTGQTQPHHADCIRNIYPQRLDYANQVLEYANKEVGRFANSADLHSQACQANLLALLLAPVKAYFSLFTALALPSFAPLLLSQTYPTRRAVAGEVARNILRNETLITTPEDLSGVLEIVKVLIKEGLQQPVGYPGGPARRGAAETDETVEEQGWLARIVHLIKGKDANTQFKVRRRSSIGISIIELVSLTRSIATPNDTRGFCSRQRAYQVYYASPVDRYS